MRIHILLVFLCLTQAAAGQNKTFKARAEKAFAEKDYVTAAYYYDQALEQGSTTQQGMVPYFSQKQGMDSAGVNEVRYQLAESYRLYQNYQLAEGWYKQVMEGSESNYPLARLWYGSCLRANDMLSEALIQLRQFIRTHSDNKDYSNYIIIANNELKDCLFAIKQHQTLTTTTIVKLESTFSSSENDFAVSIAGGKYWFTGTSSASKNKYLNQIFISDRDSLTKTTQLVFPGKETPGMHVGTPSLDLSGEKMYLTRWYKEGGKILTGIYLSRYESGQWSSPVRLNNAVNVEGLNSKQPFVTPDGKQLYFVSNRRGGSGGEDIWFSDLNAEGQPLNAYNLGKDINTGADENTPFFDPRKNRLVFSSKGYVGMGNFDLYESVKTDSSWTAARNLGQPYNSTKDDLYYFEDDQEEGMAYISSDRESDCCLNLFSVHAVKAPIQSALFVGKVKSCDSGSVLSGVKVELVDAMSKQTFSSITDSTGSYSFNVKVKRAYQLRLEKAGYFSKTIAVPAFASFQKDTVYNTDICLQMFVVDRPIVIQNVLYDFNKAILKPASMLVLNDLVTVLLDNPKIRIELSAHTDSVGTDSYNFKLSQQRAQSCVDYIISSGISGSRISARGYGETRPVEPNSLTTGKDNPEGRRLNRRTEFMVISIH